MIKKLIELLRKTKSGLNLATPVFDGAKNDDIKIVASIWPR